MDNQELVNGLKDILKEMNYDKANAERFCNDPANRYITNRLDKHCEYLKLAIETIMPKLKKKYTRLEIEESLPFHGRTMFYLIGYGNSVSDVLYGCSKREDVELYAKENSHKFV